MPSVEIRGTEYPASIRLGDREIACVLSDSALPALMSVTRGEHVTVFAGGHQPVYCLAADVDVTQNYLHVKWRDDL